MKDGSGLVSALCRSARCCNALFQDIQKGAVQEVGPDIRLVLRLPWKESFNVRLSSGSRSKKVLSHAIFFFGLYRFVPVAVGL